MPYLIDGMIPLPTDGNSTPVDEDLQDNTGNSAPVNGSDPDINSGTLFTPEPNLMSEIYQPTYYFKLYVLNDLNPDEANQVIIAETGLTALNITEVKIDGIVGPNMRTRNSLATNITIKLTEPFGMNLPDRMVGAARQLKIKNYLKTTFMLRLKLQGYDSTGNSIAIGQGWCWRIMIIDIKTTVSEAGAEHEISAIPYPEMALQDRNGVLPTNITVDGGTIGDLLKNVIDQMNKYSEEVHGFDFLTYDIIDVPYPQGVAEGVSRPFEHSVVASMVNEESERAAGITNQIRAHFSQGTDIPAIVDTVFSASESAVALGTVERSITSTVSETTMPTSIMHRVETYVVPTKFDPVYGDYQKKITFVIRPYETMRIQSGLSSADRDQTLGAQEKIQHAIKRAFLCKQYDYIFTGLNTEIEKFDIELNFRWAVSAPLLYQNGASGNTPGYNNTTLPRHVRDAPNPTSPQQRRAIIGELTDTRVELLGRIRADVPTDEDTEETRATRIANQAEYRRLTQQQGQLMYESKRDGEIRAGLLQDAGAFDSPETILAEDLNIDLSSVHPMTISASSEDPSIQAGVGITAQRNGTKSVYGTLLNQLYGSFDGNLQTINLEIRGDPYWLGPDPTPDTQFTFATSDVATRGGDSNIETPNFMNGEHMFAFNFGLPQGFDDDTNNVSLSKDETYSGFYAVTKIEHRFAQGKFTQMLEAVRIPGIALSDLNNGSEQDETTDRGDLQINQPTNTPASTSDSGGSTRYNPPPIDSSLEGSNEDDI